MSVDLDWDNLTSELANSLVEILNRQLSSVTRPSFIGPVEVLSFEFGNVPPDVEVIDIRNIHPDFLEDDDPDLPHQPEDGYANQPPELVEEGSIEVEDNFEWVPRRALRGKGLEDGYHPPHPPHPLSHLPGGVGRGSPRIGVMDMFGSTPSLHHGNLPNQGSDVTTNSDSQPIKHEHPNLQLHLHISWESNLRLTLTTSLLINYPSPMFMTLPIKLSVTGLVFEGQLAVAYQGEKRRVHLCILDELDQYVPSAPHRNRDSGTSMDKSNPNPSKPLPIGQRLLPNIYIESEIGQADKHVLKNVTRVERFIQDVIRKSIVEELVFPNFHTLILGDGS
ncbi:hypothetical protein BDM02DRAFT_3151609 [Thelephora ganbajun]|uniref:Uncharacterized protein n=1 Tax=Thelephora ganbajun TaxID=370292 RepID=A0ACB6Z2B2_THEGA|nr:hypothetical protein BDM02DRAFT_3151609 [Thelephora ganbajun]